MLSTALSSVMGRELKPEEVQLIEEEVAKSIEPLIRLHIQTSKNCHKSLSREGELPRKWSEEKLRETVRLSEIRSKVTHPNINSAVCFFFFTTDCKRDTKFCYINKFVHRELTLVTTRKNRE